MNLAFVVVILLSLLLSAESLWLFALSEHLARFMETVAPLFWVASLFILWATYWRNRSQPPTRAAMRVSVAGVALVVAGALLGAIAIAVA